MLTKTKKKKIVKNQKDKISKIQNSTFVRTTQKKSQKRFETIQNDVHEKLKHSQKCQSQTELKTKKKKKKNNKRPSGLEALLGHLLANRIPVTYQFSSIKIPEYLSQK